MVGGAPQDGKSAPSNADVAALAGIVMPDVGGIDAFDAGLGPDDAGVDPRGYAIFGAIAARRRDDAERARPAERTRTAARQHGEAVAGAQVENLRVGHARADAELAPRARPVGAQDEH